MLIRLVRTEPVYDIASHLTRRAEDGSRVTYWVLDWSSL